MWVKYFLFVKMDNKNFYMSAPWNFLVSIKNQFVCTYHRYGGFEKQICSRLPCWAVGVSRSLSLWANNCRLLGTWSERNSSRYSTLHNRTVSDINHPTCSPLTHKLISLFNYLDCWMTTSWVALNPMDFLAGCQILSNWICVVIKLQELNRERLMVHLKSRKCLLARTKWLKYTIKCFWDFITWRHCKL